MLSRLRDFISRHRRKFIVTGVVVGGTFFAIKYAQRKLIEFQERQAREFIENTRRTQHFESTERTCNQVIIGMGSELCTAIIRECSTDELLNQLRQNPENKLQLWEEMKIVAFTRLTTFIYASSMLVIALRVQMNLLGGYLYHDIITEEKQISNELKQQYLSLISHFIHEGGLGELVRLIRAKVNIVMRQLPLTHAVSLADLEQLFWSLQMAINSDAKGDPNSAMARYLMPSQSPADGCSPLLQKMYSETLDLLESDDAATVCSSNICRGFSLAVDVVAESLGETVVRQQRPSPVETTGEATTSKAAAAAAAAATSGSNAPSQAPGNSNGTRIRGTDGRAMYNNNNIDSLVNINSVQIALAKLIPIVSGITSKGFDRQSRPMNLATLLVTSYVVAEKSKMLGANVYETFSSP